MTGAGEPEATPQAPIAAQPDHAERTTVMTAADADPVTVAAPVPDAAAKPVPPEPASHPHTGDEAVDAALRELAAVPDLDLDALLAAGEAVDGTLRARLADLGD